MFLKFDNVDFGVVDYRGITIIHQVFVGGQATLARELLQPQYRIDPEQRDVYDMTIMDIAIRRFDAELLAILLRVNCKLPDTMEIFGNRNPWARQDITSSEDPISMPTFEFVFGAGAIEVAGMLYEAGMQLGIRYRPVEDKYHSLTFGRLVRYPLVERHGEGSSEWVKAATLTPRSLKIQCRAAIRGRLGSKLHATCDSLELPDVLIEYLLIG